MNVARKFRGIVAVGLLLTIVSPATARYSGGTGEPNDPYQIAAVADLITLSESPGDYGACFVLTANIDLDPNLPGRKVFDKAIISTLTGVFDGGGHTILHLTIRGGGYLGLFGELRSGARVSDVGVADVNITASDDYTGGLVGVNGGVLTGCYTTGVVRGREDVGGLVGDNAGMAAHCYSVCAVRGGNGVGGLMGENSNGTVSDCYSTGLVESAGWDGGLMAYDQGGVTHCFWDTQTSGQATSAGGTGKPTAEMQTAKTFLDAGWDFVGETANGTEDIWRIFEGRDYPRLWWEPVLGDDFGDGKAEPLWMAYEPQPQAVRLKEVNGRLEVEAVAQPEDVDSIYVAHGWRLDVTKGFALQVGFHFSKSGVGDGRVTLGVVPSLDPSGMRWAEFEAGCFDSGPFSLYSGPFYLCEVSYGSFVAERVKDRSSNDGTLYMSYDPDTDELYVSDTGYGKPNAWHTVPGLLKGRWASEPVCVILSGGSKGMALTGEDAWLDDFAVSSGTLILPAAGDESNPDDE